MQLRICCDLWAFMRVLSKDTHKPQTPPIMHLNEMPPPPKGYRRNTITKAQRGELLEELRRRYRERKANELPTDKTNDENKTPASN